MARPAKSLAIYHKAEAALIAAIEIYNKPDFAYREETFAILAINAWELLLKAKVLAENTNRLQALWVYECRQRADGTPLCQVSCRMAGMMPATWQPKQGAMVGTNREAVQ